MELLLQIMEVCIVPLLGILVKYVVDFLNAKRTELNTKIDNELAQKYIDMITDTVTKCVITTNQTYVNALKEQGSFDSDTWKTAFNRTYNDIVAILSEDAKKYIEETYGDIQKYLKAQIEATVNKEKKG